MSRHRIHHCRACGLRVPRAASEGAASACPACGHPATAEPSFVTPAASGPARAPATEVAVLLDNVRSLANVGAIFRSADGVGARHVYLAGISPTPEHPRLAKTALGAEAFVPWSHDPDPLAAARRATDDGFDLWILEGDGEDLFSRAQAGRRPVCVVAGHERAGVDPRMRAHASRIVRIPMCGTKTSLNVATAVTLALYSVRFGLCAPAGDP